VIDKACKKKKKKRKKKKEKKEKLDLDIACLVPFGRLFL
jgi:hypothetical protein